MRTLLLILIFAIPVSMTAQSPPAQEQTIKKNALYFSGDWMTKNLSASLNYERSMLISGSGQFQISSSLGYGRWYTVDSKGSNYNMNLHLIAGVGVPRVELTMGLRCIDNEGHYFYPEPPEGLAESVNNQLSFFPHITIGFRYQKPGGRLLLRAAMGIPFLQFSLGYQF